MTARSQKTKRQAWRFGRYAETFAAWHLRLRGYRILASGFRTAMGEIDIMARRGNTLAMIEVKARGNLAQAAEALDRRQQQRITRAASAHLAAHPACAGLDV